MRHHSPDMLFGFYRTLRSLGVYDTETFGDGFGTGERKGAWKIA